MAYWGLMARGLRHARQRDRPPPVPSADLPPMSVIVAARDEEAALPALLRALARQTHPRFEVVIADDASADGTAALVRAWQRRHAGSDRFTTRLVEITRPKPPRKKHALTCAIAAASHGLLAFTDADCAPPPGWLRALATRHAASEGDASGGGALLIGYSPFREGHGWLGRLARYETFVTGVYTAATAGLRRPYMAVGRNLSYPKALFERIGGFAHQQQSMSGDDDLLVQHVARERAAPVRHVFGPATQVPTGAPSSWRAWLRQKRRHASAGRFYAAGPRRHLAAFHATGAALWGAPLLAGWAGAGLLAAKLAAQGLVLRRAARAFGEDDLLPAFPLLELLYAGHHALSAPLSLLRAPEEW